MAEVAQAILLMKPRSLSLICSVIFQESSSSTLLLGAAVAFGMRLTRMAAPLVKFVPTTNLRSKNQALRLPHSSITRGTLKAGATVLTSTLLAIVRALVWSIRSNLARLPMPLVAASLCAGTHRSHCSVWKTIVHHKPKRQSATTALT